MSRDHRRLRAFELADGLTISVYQATRTFPDSERFGLVAQVRRAAVSVPANIVEGCGRETDREFRQFLVIALGSLREVGYLISLSARLGFLPEDQQSDLLAKYEEAAKVIHGLIGALDRG